MKWFSPMYTSLSSFNFFSFIPEIILPTYNRESWALCIWLLHFLHCTSLNFNLLVFNILVATNWHLLLGTFTELLDYKYYEKIKRWTFWKFLTVVLSLTHREGQKDTDTKRGNRQVFWFNCHYHYEVNVDCTTQLHWLYCQINCCTL